MKIEEKKKYILTFNIGGKILSFEAKILNLTEETIIFLDKFGEELEYKKEYLIGRKLLR